MLSDRRERVRQRRVESGEAAFARLVFESLRRRGDVECADRARRAFQVMGEIAANFRVADCMHARDETRRLCREQMEKLILQLVVAERLRVEMRQVEGVRLRRAPAIAQV